MRPPMVLALAALVVAGTGAFVALRRDHGGATPSVAVPIPLQPSGSRTGARSPITPSNAGRVSFAGFESTGPTILGVSTNRRFVAFGFGERWSISIVDLVRGRTRRQHYLDRRSRPREGEVWVSDTGAAAAWGGDDAVFVSTDAGLRGVGCPGMSFQRAIGSDSDNTTVGVVGLGHGVDEKLTGCLVDLAHVSLLERRRAASDRDLGSFAFRKQSVRLVSATVPKELVLTTESSVTLAGAGRVSKIATAGNTTLALLDDGRIVVGPKGASSPVAWHTLRVNTPVFERASLSADGSKAFVPSPLRFRDVQMFDTRTARLVATFERDSVGVVGDAVLGEAVRRTVGDDGVGRERSQLVVVSDRAGAISTRPIGVVRERSTVAPALVGLGSGWTCSQLGGAGPVTCQTPAGRRVLGAGEDIGAVAVSVSHGEYVVTTQNGLERRRLRDDVVLGRLPDNIAETPVYLPSGDLVAVDRGQRVVKVTADAGAVINVLSPRSGYTPTVLAANPEGTSVAVRLSALRFGPGSVDGTEDSLAVVDLATGAASIQPGYPRTVAWSPDGSRIVTATHTELIEFRSPRTPGAALEVLRKYESHALFDLADPLGRGANRGDVEFVTEAPAGPDLGRLRGRFDSAGIEYLVDGDRQPPFFQLDRNVFERTPSGSYRPRAGIVSRGMALDPSRPGRVAVRLSDAVEVLDARAETRRTIATPGGACAAFAPDGVLLVLEESRVRRFAADGQRRSASEARIEPLDLPICSVSPDGRLLAAQNGRGLALFDARSLAQLGSVMVVGERADTLTWAPDGSEIVAERYNARWAFAVSPSTEKG